MNYKKLLCVLFCIILCIAVVGCNLTPTNPNQGGLNKPDFSDGKIPDKNDDKKPNNPDVEIPDNNDVDVKEPDDTDHDFNLVSQDDGTFTYICTECNEEKKVVIKCVSGSEKAYSVEESTLTFSNITENSVYDISGAFHLSLIHI